MEINTIETVGVVIFNVTKTEVLLVENLPKAEHLSNTFGIPAGRLENNQSLIENAIRELEEETGLTTKETNLKKLPFSYEADIPRKDGTIKHFHLVTYLCDKFAGNLKESTENKPVWVQIDKIQQLNLLPNMEKVIVDALQYQNK